MVAEELDGEEGWEVVAGCGAESRMEEKKQAVLELLREDALSFLPNQPSTPGHSVQSPDHGLPSCGDSPARLLCVPTVQHVAHRAVGLHV